VFLVESDQEVRTAGLGAFGKMGVLLVRKPSDLSGRLNVFRFFADEAHNLGGTADVQASQYFEVLLEDLVGDQPHDGRGLAPIPQEDGAGGARWVPPKAGDPGNQDRRVHTPLRGRFHGFGDNGRLSPSSAAPNICDGSDDILGGHAFDALRTFE